MKEIMDPVRTSDMGEKESFANRKLIRPTLPRVENHGNHGNHHPVAVQPQERRDRSERSHSDRMHDRGADRGDRSERNDRNDRSMGGGKRPAPPEQTNAENFYYQKQMQARTAMVIVLRDGEEIRGIIEWYDKNCLKVNRDSGEPNLMIYKPAIKYMYKEDENGR